ncbi:MAG: MafB19-like deaminase, partial [Bacteroidota bacterium]
METFALDDEYFMRAALSEAKKAFDSDEVPVGAVIVCK